MKPVMILRVGQSVSDILERYVRYLRRVHRAGANGPSPRGTLAAVEAARTVNGTARGAAEPGLPAQGIMGG